MQYRRFVNKFQWPPIAGSVLHYFKEANFMKKLVLLLCCVVLPAMAQDFLSQPEVAPDVDAERDPASLAPVVTKRNYPGGADEEDLRVQAYIPEASLKTDARVIQREVYKSLFNQDLKDERNDIVEE
jgi:hypothetical protein